MGKYIRSYYIFRYKDSDEPGIIGNADEIAERIGATRYQVYRASYSGRKLKGWYVMVLGDPTQHRFRATNGEEVTEGYATDVADYIGIDESWLRQAAKLGSTTRSGWKIERIINERWK